MKQSNAIWTKRALKDLEVIYDFLGSKSQTAALKLIIKLLEIDRYFNTSLFIDGPSQPSKSKKHDYRYIVESGHKIIYYRTKSSVYIVGVFDTRQNPKKFKL